MSGLKKNQPALRVAKSEFAITPDEQDRYEVYDIIFPTAAVDYVGTVVVAGTSTVDDLVIDNRLLDYPRNLELTILGSHGAMVGTITVNGKNQFGEDVSETIAIAAGSLGGTTAGTEIFRQVDNGTFSFGTAVGNGTPTLGVGTLGSTAAFGLPVKIGAASDVVALNYSSEMAQTAVNGGTIAAFVDATNHAIYSPVDVIGTMTMQVWVVSTFNNENLSKVSGGTQVV